VQLPPVGGCWESPMDKITRSRVACIVQHDLQTCTGPEVTDYFASTTVMIRSKRRKVSEFSVID